MYASRRWPARLPRTRSWSFRQTSPCPNHKEETMERMDSRHLNKYDSYIRRFDRPGHYRYRINYLSPALAKFQSGPVYELVVRPSKGEEQRQHSVQVSYDEKARHFHAEPARLDV